MFEEQNQSHDIDNHVLPLKEQYVLFMIKNISESSTLTREGNAFDLKILINYIFASWTILF